MMGMHFMFQGRKQAAHSKWLSQRRLEKIRDAREERLILKRSATAALVPNHLLVTIEQQMRSGDLPVSDRCCPECGVPMGMATLLDFEFECCRQCEGLWFDPGELRSLTGFDKDIPSDDLTSRLSGRRCPVCAEEMTEFVFLTPFNLLVDQCRRGHGLYLQEREINRVFELVD